jgi:acyl-CoA dehydrogenase
MQNPDDIEQIIEDTTERLLSAHCSAERLKAAEGSWSVELWKELEHAGLTSALEPAGRSELGIPVGAALNIARAAGRFSAPVPLVENMLAIWFLKAAGLRVAPGPWSIAPVNGIDQISVSRVGPKWRLTGTAARVPWGRCAANLLVAAHAEGRSFLASVPAAAFKEVIPGENLAREPRDRVSFDADLESDAVAEFEDASGQLYSMGAALRVMQIAGALAAVLELTVEYAQQRRQFGRPIGKFQAIQQSIAVMAANVATALTAADSFGENILRGEGRFSIAAAKLRANEAATVASKLAHQVHGAMGFTQEYGLHFLTKRLWSWRDEFGNENVWGRRLGEEVCRRGPDRLWDFITSEMD